MSPCGSLEHVLKASSVVLRGQRSGGDQVAMACLGILTNESSSLQAVVLVAITAVIMPVSPSSTPASHYPRAQHTGCKELAVPQTVFLSGGIQNPNTPCRCSGTPAKP